MSHWVYEVYGWVFCKQCTVIMASFKVLSRHVSHHEVPQCPRLDLSQSLS
jgi:hypothetical protein